MVAVTTVAQQQPQLQRPEAVMKRGEYNANAATQAEAAEIALQLLVEAAEHAPITPGTPVQVLELGCSEGVNSMQPVKTILQTLASRLATANGATAATATTAKGTAADGSGADAEAAKDEDTNGHSQLQRLEVVVFHDDLPSNDFQPLLQLIGDKEKTYMPQDSQSPLAVFPSVIGRSLYERLRPDASVHLVFSFTTLQWLSRMPALVDQLFPVQDDGRQHAPDQSAEQRAKHEALEEQSRSDLTRVLELRAAEVVPGGMMQAHFVIRDSTPKTAWAVQHLTAAATEWVAAGKLTGAEVAAMAIPIHQRSEQLVGEVLEGVKEVWEAKRFFTKFVESPPYTQWSAGSISAAEYASTTRKQRAAVFQGYMTAQLALTRGRAQAEALTDQLFDEFERRLAVAPSEEGLLMVYMLLQRTSAPAPAAGGLDTRV